MTDINKAAEEFLQSVQELTEAEVTKYASSRLQTSFFRNDPEDFQMRLAKTALVFQTRYGALQECYDKLLEDYKKDLEKMLQEKYVLIQKLSAVAKDLNDGCFP